MPYLNLFLNLTPWQCHCLIVALSLTTSQTKARKPPEAVVDSCLGRDTPPKVGLGLVMNLASTAVGARDPVRLYV
jgi:hypothetical protein